MWKAMTSRLNSALKTLLRNIHTILLFVGIAFIATSAFLYSVITGFLVLGVSLIIVSLLISRGMG